jgi:hypothetical protein
MNFGNFNYEPKPVQESDISNFIKMYELDENHHISEKAISRYFTTKEKYQEILGKVEEICRINSSTPKREVFEFIQAGLQEHNKGIQAAVFRLIRKDFISDKVKICLISLGLDCVNIEVQREASERLQRYRSSDLISQESKDEFHQKVFENLKELITNNNPNDLEFINEVIFTLPSRQDELRELLSQNSRLGLSSNDSRTREISVKNLVLCADRYERSVIIIECLQNEYADVQHMAGKMMEMIPDEDALIILPKCLSHPNSMVQVSAVKSILGAWVSSLSEDQKIDIIKTGMQHRNTGVQQLCAKYGDQLGLHETMPEFTEWILELITPGFDSNDSAQCQFAIDLINYAPKDEKENLFKIAIEKGMEKFLVNSPLYKSNELSRERFSRKIFINKHSSGSILFGGNLIGKSIMRRISELEALVAWQKAYEDYPAWQRNGFDYVPVEPIQNFNIIDGVANVFVGVLDASVADWYAKTNLFEDEISEQIEKIKKTLKEIGVSHNDDEDRNFCLYFIRDEQGNPDFSIPPRVYIIDFELALLDANQS